MNRYKCLALLVCVCLAACSTKQDPYTFIEPEQSEKTLSAEARSQVAIVSSAVPTLSLDTALRLCESHHPELVELAAYVTAAEGELAQAGLLPNPRLIARVEQIPTRGPANDTIQPIIGVSQEIPIGGRLKRESEFASQRHQIAVQNYDLGKSKILRKVRGRFATALFLQRVLTLKQQNANTAKRFIEITKARVELGDIPPDELARVELEAFQVQADYQKTREMLQTANIQLAAAIGANRVFFDTLQGELEASFQISRAAELLKNLERLPDYQLAEAKVEASRAKIALIEAERVPDLEFEVLYRRLELERIDSVDLSLSIPLTIFDRRNGDLKAAKARLAASVSSRERVRSELQLRIQQSSATLKSALARGTMLRTKVLPRSRQILEATRLRYESGDVALSEVLAQQRVGAAIEMLYLESLREVMVAWADMSSLSAGASKT